MDNASKIILDLCGGTGAWSEPYRKAGYDVRLITLPNHDVCTYIPPDNVYGILAAPPCTDFTSSGAQYWSEKDKDGRTIKSLSILISCLRIISLSGPIFWALENPVGRLTTQMGMLQPQMKFNPCDYGDPYTKKTYIWGRFNAPEKMPVDPEYVICRGKRYSPIHYITGGNSERTKMLRSITPPGFAEAFFKANK